MVLQDDGSLKAKAKSVPSSSYSVKWPKKCKAVGKHWAKVTLADSGRWDGSSAWASWEVVPRAAKGVAAKRSGKAATVSWSKMSSADCSRYELRYSASKSMSKAKSARAAGSSKSAKIGGLKAHKKYWVQVRRAKKAGGEWFRSEWSKPVAIPAA